MYYLNLQSNPNGGYYYEPIVWMKKKMKLREVKKLGQAYTGRKCRN